MAVNTKYIRSTIGAATQPLSVTTQSQPQPDGTTPTTSQTPYDPSVQTQQKGDVVISSRKEVATDIIKQGMHKSNLQIINPVAWGGALFAVKTFGSGTQKEVFIYDPQTVSAGPYKNISVPLRSTTMTPPEYSASLQVAAEQAAYNKGYTTGDWTEFSKITGTLPATTSSKSTDTGGGLGGAISDFFSGLFGGAKGISTTLVIIVIIAIVLLLLLR